MLFIRGFILKPTERASVFLKNGTRNFQNSIFKIFYLRDRHVLMRQSLERFQYLNFETKLMEKERFFQKAVVPLFS